ncbi:basic-leucine zipper transcription factor A [Drosophila rhopaloa]|uniref:Basic-leucine zipper transcription factor A n=1 Tax=Drosophila rhopaloa TaxID=1041015 RepID=A0A6P4EBW8_DRORH|nr:basic-leucine zipper transcription factor A [Drosophila rhopaloa]
MHSLRLLVLLGALLATQGRVLDQEKIPEIVASPADLKPLEVKQEVVNEIRKTEPQLIGNVNSQEQPTNPISEETKESQPQVAIEQSQSHLPNSIGSEETPSEAIKPVEVIPAVTKGNQESQSQLTNSIVSQDASSKTKKTEESEPAVTKGNQESISQLANSINSQVAPSEPIKPVKVDPEAAKGNQETPAQLSNTINSEGVQASTEEKQPTSNEINKELPKQEVGPQNSAKQGRDNKIQFAYGQPGQTQTQNQDQLISVQDLEKIFKNQGVQFQSLDQYQNLFNKFQPQYVSVVNTPDANTHNQAHYYPNQKKPGFPFSFLPNPFEKNEPTYVRPSPTTSSTTVVSTSSTTSSTTDASSSSTTSSTTDVSSSSTTDVTQHTHNHIHIHEETKPFPFLPNPFTDFPKVVGLSLVLLPNPFYVNKSNSQTHQAGEYQYLGKFRAFSEEEPQKQQQSQKPNFYLIPNPFANLSNESQKEDGNVLLSVNLASLPLLVPAPEISQGKASSGSISFQDLIKAGNVHVSQPLKLPANNGLSQIQKEQAAIHQLILNHLSEQTNLFQKQSLGNGKRSQPAPSVAVQEEEESSVLFAVEIPKSIYRFFKGIFGGFSN